jgi:hypothetical protein
MKDNQSKTEKGECGMQATVRELHSTSRKLYDAFLDYSFPELEELLYSAKDKDEKDFYAGLCQFFISRNQERVLEKYPF